MKLSVIIVNYNVRFFLEQALLSAQKAAQRIPTEIFVVDNNSKDDSVAMVRERFPDVHLIANTDNPGFSKANNQAIRRSKGEYVLLLNPDTVVAEDTFENCVQFMDSRPRCGGLGAKMIDGSGTFLPESKRGFPSPFVAFCKTFGLSTLFPKSKIFNQYHLGFLDSKKNHKVDILAGAFMMMRKSVLDEVGLLDETFFMYGEDIDLSYRIQQGGYDNYYFAESTIIHYKGESTKKGSLNYVKVFYQAMIIFAKKHFSGSQGALFVFVLQLAIYFRATLTLVSNFIKKTTFPLLEGGLIALGLFLLKDFWANYYFQSPNYYDVSFLWFNIPLYTVIWIASIFFNGGYDNVSKLHRPFRGLFIGTILLSAIYGFLDEELRSSRMLIVLGAIWALVSVLGSRLCLHFFKYKNFNLGTSSQNNLIIVGDKAEVERTLKLIQQTQISKNIIGSVALSPEDDDAFCLGGIEKLDEITKLYKVNEIIFCSKVISYKKIIAAIEELGSHIQYRILPENATTIIGSHSKNSTGHLYTIDVHYNITERTQKRNKRMLDIFLALFFLVFFPIFLFTVKNKQGFLQNIFFVLIGKKTWVGYHDSATFLPPLRPSILHPVDAFSNKNIDEKTLDKLDFFYAKDYRYSDDVGIVWRAVQQLGRKSENYSS